MTDSKPRKPKRTKEAILEETLAKARKLEAQIDGTWVAENEEKTGVKAVKAALRRRKTELHGAEVLVNGRASTQKSPALSGVAEKIANAQRRLDGYIEAQRRGEEFLANLPFDINRLTDLLKYAEVEGEDVEVPNDLFRLNADEKTEAEIEAASTMTDAEIAD